MFDELHASCCNLKQLVNCICSPMRTPIKVVQRPGAAFGQAVDMTVDYSCSLQNSVANSAGWVSRIIRDVQDVRLELLQSQWCFGFDSSCVALHKACT